MAAMMYTDIPEIVPDAGRRSYRLSPGSFWDGGLMGVLAGLLVPWSDVAGITFAGFLLSHEPSAGNIETETGNANGFVQQAGDIIHGVSVAGASTVADLYTPVYCPTDNWRTDLTTAPTANAKAIGYIDKFNQNGSFDVVLLTPKEYLAQA